MTAYRVIHRGVLTILLALAAAAASAQTPATQAPFVPSVGQPGKDVVWVPTPDKLVEKMLDMANVTAQDYVIDLGSGDGKTVIAAAKRGARALGIEYNPDMVELAKQNAAKAGVVGQSQLHEGRHLRERLLEGHRHHSVPAADAELLKLRPTLLESEAGARGSCRTPSRWRTGSADETATLHRGLHQGWCTALFWIIPAKVEGTWRARPGRAHAQAGVSEGPRARSEASQSPRASCGATRSRSPSARPSTPDA